MILEFAAVGAGGFIGSCVRFGLSRLLPATAFPFATLYANVLAGLAICILFGLYIAAPLPPKLKLFASAGVLGGLSTFSTFSLEAVNLFRDGKYLLGGGYVLISLTLSLLGVAAGMAAAKSFVK